MTYYKIIGGNRYDRQLLDAADAFTKGRGESRISLEEMQELFRQAADGQGITNLERNTLDYIAKHYTLTDKARKWLAEQMPDTVDPATATITRVLRQESGLADIQFDINPEVVGQYTDGGGSRDLEAIMRSVIQAYLKGSQGQLSFAACVARHDDNEMSDTTSLLQSYLNRGTLFLIPPNATPENALPYDLPAGPDTANFWIFALRTPDFEPVEFFAFVHRDLPLQFNKGQFSKKADLEKTIHAAVRQFAQFDLMQWDIPLAEVQRQMALKPDQNFGNALFSALHAGIFNRESSFSFGDFIQQEIWPDPDIATSQQMREYADTGTLYLLPLDYRAQTDGGTAAFPVPQQYDFQMDYEWIFGLKMPSKTQICLLINTPRENNNGDTAWNDCFIDDPLPVQERLQKVIAEEFKVDGLKIQIDESEFEKQRQQSGPDWVHLPGLFRLVLNTMLHDYLSINGVFNMVAQSKKTQIDPAQFDNPKAYRAAIQHLIENYLRTGEAFKMFSDDPEENPIANGETVAQNWVFRGVLPKLADHWFWIIIPRSPDDEQRPYNYIS